MEDELLEEKDGEKASGKSIWHDCVLLRDAYGRVSTTKLYTGSLIGTWTPVTNLATYVASISSLQLEAYMKIGKYRYFNVTGSGSRAIKAILYLRDQHFRMKYYTVNGYKGSIIEDKDGAHMGTTEAEQLKTFINACMTDGTIYHVVGSAVIQDKVRG